MKSWTINIDMKMKLKMDVGYYANSDEGIGNNADGDGEEGSDNSSDEYCSSSSGSSRDDSSISGDESSNISDDMHHHPDADEGEEIICQEEEIGGFHDDDYGMNNLNHQSDIDMQKRRSPRNKIILLVLSTLLTGLLANFVYGLVQLFKASSVSVIDNNYDGKNSQEESYSAMNNNVGESNSKRNPNLENNANEYQMPQDPTRIFKHATLSSANYRAGGVLSDEMLQRYEEDGVLVIRNLISPKLLDRLDMASEILIRDGQSDEGKKKKRRGKQFHMVKNGAVFLGVPPPNEDTTCNVEEEEETCNADIREEDNNDNIILSSFRDLAMYSKIPRVAASLLRLDELRVGGEEYLKHNNKRRRAGDDNINSINDSINLRICRDIFLTKDDDEYACGWHVDDTGFWPSISSDPGVNAWVALDDMPAPWKTQQASNPVATFTLSLGSHRSTWRHDAYKVTGSTHTMPVEGFQSAADVIQRRSGSGTCNIQSSAPDLYEKLEKNKVIYDLKRGDVIFHDRWVFHRTVTVSEYEKMTLQRNSAQELNVSEERAHTDKIFRRYSIRYAPGTARVPPGYGVELSVLHDNDNANRTLDDIVERSGPWYPKVWPHGSKQEEIEGLKELVHEKMPKAEELQRVRKKELQRLLSVRGKTVT